MLPGFIRDKFVLFPKLLEENGYHVGSTGKRYWPRTKNVEGAVDEPIGIIYQKNLLESRPEGISWIDYVADFEQILDESSGDKPFFFWVGTGEPHRPYQKNRGVEYAHYYNFR